MIISQPFSRRPRTEEAELPLCLRVPWACAGLPSQEPHDPLPLRTPVQGRRRETKCGSQPLRGSSFKLILRFRSMREMKMAVFGKRGARSPLYRL